MTDESKPRPGGRSSRVKAAVFQAVESLLGETPDQVPSIAAIAQRAGVNPASLYRRWGDAQTLVAAVAVERLMRDNPMPDSGSLRGDLVAWGSAIVRSLSEPKDGALLRIMMVSARGDRRADDPVRPIDRRSDEIDAMLRRARQRGEHPPLVDEVLEIVLAPLYLHVLFYGAIDDPLYVERLVDRALMLVSAD